jgi:hypothetical protein
VFGGARKALRKIEKFPGRFRERSLLFWVPLCGDAGVPDHLRASNRSARLCFEGAPCRNRKSIPKIDWFASEATSLSLRAIIYDS